MAERMRSLMAASVAAALAGLLFGFDTAVISGVIGPLAAEFVLTPAEQGWTVSSALIGTLLAAMFSGTLGDKFGSRYILLWVGSCFIVSAIGCAIATGPASFGIFRFVGGLAIGGASVLAPVFISEISPAARRGFLVGMFQIFIVIGILLAYVSNALVDVINVGPTAWRWKMAVLIAPGSIFMAAMFCTPQSPRWLASKGDTATARAIATQLGMGDVALTYASDSAAHLSWARHRRPILLAIALASFNQLSGINAILYYLNDIFASGGYTALSSILQAVAVGVANLFATLVGMVLIDRLGRRTLLLIGSVGTASALAGIALIYVYPGYEQFLLLLLIIYISFFAISQGAVIWVYLSEIFPTPVRARGQALGSATHWIWAAILSGSFKWIADSFDKALPFWFFAAMMALQFFVVWKVFPETGGKSLEEIEADMASGEQHAS